MLRLLGFYEELGPGESYASSMREAMRDRPGPDEDGLTRYLSSGYVVFDVMETSADVISGDRRIIGAPSFVTDGEWLWRLDLVSYVSRYHLCLPSDFAEHARSREFRVPQLTEEHLEAVGTEATSYF
jgi:hypothetical protein